MADEVFFQIGDKVVITGTFTTNGTPTTPTTTTCTVLQPGGTSVDVSMTESAAGVMRGEFEPTVAGLHTVRLKGTGAAHGAARPTSFEVEA